MNVGQCPELQKLEMYSAGLLSDNERFAIENHLLDCEICSDYVEGLSLISNSINIDNAENEIKEHIHKILYPEKKRFIGSVFYKRMAVAASVLILITASIFVYYHHNLSTKQIAEQVKPITNRPFDDKKTDSSVIKIVAQVSVWLQINLKCLPMSLCLLPIRIINWKIQIELWKRS